MHRCLNTPVYSFHSTRTPSYDSAATEPESPALLSTKLRLLAVTLEGSSPPSPAQGPMTCSFSVLVCPVSLSRDPFYHLTDKKGPFYLSLPQTTGQLYLTTASSSSLDAFWEELVVGFGEITLNLCCDFPQSGQKHHKDSEDRQPVSLKYTLLAGWTQHPRDPHDGLVG